MEADPSNPGELQAHGGDGIVEEAGIGGKVPDEEGEDRGKEGAHQ